MRNTINILGVNIDYITKEETLQKIISFTKGNGLKMVFTPNSEIIDYATKDEEFRNILNNADICIADGIGLIWGARILGNKLPGRVTGFDTTLELLKYGQDGSITFYIFGAAPGVAEKAKEKLESTYPNIKILGVQNGYYKPDEEIEIINKINDLAPDVLFVPQGSPRQERLIFRHKDNLQNVKVCIGNGGTFDIIAGTLTRAPKLIQKCGLEWLYRFILEPSRYKRVLKLFRFGIIVIITKLTGKNK